MDKYIPANSHGAPPALDSSAGSKLRRIRWVTDEWLLGCSCSMNWQTGKRLPPEACEECTEAALDAVKSVLTSSN